MDSSKETNTQDTNSDQAKSNKATALLGVYQEICKSHQAIDEFRMKLLGVLPLASLAGIFFLGKSDSQLATAAGAPSSNLPDLIAFIGIFAAIFTLALFMYEIRGILRCDELIRRGRRIERELDIMGQFWVCQKQHRQMKRSTTHAIFNAIVTACFTYSFVFTGWVFLALHNGFGFRNLHCLITAPTAGLVIGLVAYGLIKKRIAA